MAAIDKTYISDWETFDKIRNWAIDKKVPLKDGSEIPLRCFMYNPDLTKEEWDEWKAEHDKESQWEFEVVLWNTPTYVDVWLIRNCPFDEIQDRLKEQYGGGWSKTAFTDHNDDSMYEKIKNGTSIYDTFQRNGRGKDTKVRFIRTFGRPVRDKKCFWWIQMAGVKWWYNENKNMWYCDEEMMPIDSNTCDIKGPMTKKNVINLIKKWDMPSGTEIRFSCSIGRYVYHNFTAIVK